MDSGSVRLCRDENCTRVGVHAAHVVIEVVDQSEQYNADEIPWRKPAPKALDHSIARATSKTYPKPFHVILRDVEEDYGACNSRTVQRRLTRLVLRGHILRISLGRRLYAYMRPG
ncbi:MAG: hypothetical protein ACREJC_15020, partial [Tepidisphaeraceae bacterium]